MLTVERDLAAPALIAETQALRERVRVLEEALQKIGNSTGCVDACPCWAKLRREAIRATLQETDR